MYMYIYIYIHTDVLHQYICIYIYTHYNVINMCAYIYIYIYIYIYMNISGARLQETQGGALSARPRLDLRGTKGVPRKVFDLLFV